MIALTGQDVLDALGVPPASATDQAWADQAAAAANAYVNALPIASDDKHVDDVRMAGTMLAVNLYHRRATGGISPDLDLAAPMALDNTIARLLRVGGYQKPVWA